MGKILSTTAKRSTRNWNVENRAFKEIEKHKDKPKQAPLHPSTKDKIDEFREGHQEALAGLQVKNEGLHDRLSGMLAKPEKMPEPHGRPLPEDKTMREDPEYGYLEPKYIRAGKVSIRQALAFICDHHMDMKTNTSQHIAKAYKLEPHNVEQILKYFKPLQVQIPNLKKLNYSSQMLKNQTIQNLLKEGREKTDPSIPQDNPQGSDSKT